MTRVFRPAVVDGLLIVLLKLAFHYQVWQWWSRLFVRHALRIVGKLDRPASDRSATASVRRADDGYSVVSTLVLVISYAVVYTTCSSDGSASAGLVAMFLIYPTARNCEILSVTVLHHASGPYRSPAPLRAVSRIFWSYLEIVVAYACFYCAAGRWSRDKFTAGQGDLLASWLDPLYFSLATITTAGFGDFAPTRTPGKQLAMTELLTGVALLVLAVQRALAASEQPFGEESGPGAGPRDD